MHELQLGFQLMMYGLGGVFLSLIAFYLVIRGLIAISKRSANKSDDSAAN